MLTNFEIYLLSPLSHSSEADARKALSKDKQNMQHRYVELFYNSGGAGGGGGFGRGGY